ncbi:MAG: LPS export ABC transporter periplasmic protein LptC [Immundisolibacteraceae bacterium]|nr:LPS export ABC transporter periplasmic protein LptC [Immundisolibacteraceae bacterium]
MNKILVTLRQLNYRQLGLLFAVVLSWWLLQDASQPINESNPVAHRPDFWATQYASKSLDSAGIPSYELHSTKLIHFRDDGSSEFDHPRYIRHRQQKGPVTIISNDGWSNEAGSELVLIGDVIITSEGDDLADLVTAEMDELLVYPKEDFAETSSPVTIINQSGTTTGVGMHVNSRTGVLILLSNVRGRYQIVH